MTTHSTAPASGTPNERAMVGRLMLTIEPSTVVMKEPVATSASTAHLSTGRPAADEAGAVPPRAAPSGAAGPLPGGEGRPAWRGLEREVRLMGTRGGAKLAG